MPLVAILITKRCPRRLHQVAMFGSIIRSPSATFGMPKPNRLDRARAGSSSLSAPSVHSNRSIIDHRINSLSERWLDNRPNQRDRNPSFVPLRRIQLAARFSAALRSERWFHTEADFHQVADATLQQIQDAIDEAFDESTRSSGASDADGRSSSASGQPPPEYELTLASGVLTLSLPGSGTWVINKQTPNRQIWWSSPLSGPKRFEHLEGSWCSTKDGLALGPLLSQELRHVHPWLEIDLRL